MASLTLFCPAKLNLFLAITGRRPDGFHDLVSVVAPVAWGDTLIVHQADHFSLECDNPAVPIDGANLVLKAAAAFRQATGWKGGARFILQKIIPVGAGLGGGSSNAATALRALNYLAGSPLTPDGLADVASRIGSDCPLFLAGRPAVMRGRGERLTVFNEAAARRLDGREVLIFKPAFGISTAWAYAQMAKAGNAYLVSDEAEAKLADWLAGHAPGGAGQVERPLEELLFNNMEGVAFAKYPALPTLLDQLRDKYGLAPRMSGSGSACFALLDADAPIPKITAAIRAAWGDSATVVQTRFATNPH